MKYGEVQRRMQTQVNLKVFQNVLLLGITMTKIWLPPMWQALYAPTASGKGQIIQSKGLLPIIGRIF